jgi:hypothetical protein
MRFLAISFADSLLTFQGARMHSVLKATLFTALPVVREVLRAILEESGGHSNTRQREGANASHRIRDKIASLILDLSRWTWRGLASSLNHSSRFRVCSEGKDRAVRCSEPF